jgi:folate-binding protein YgfZ
MFARKSSYVCARCLSKQRYRLYSTAESATVPPSPPPASGIAKLTNRRLISLHGPDTAKFLQGITTNNVRPDASQGFYAAFLTAQGKVLHDSFIYPTVGTPWHGQQGESGDAGFLVEVDAEQVDVLMKHLKRHKLRRKFKLRVVEEGELDVWSWWREGERWTAHGTSSTPEGVLGLTDSRAPGMGQRLLLPAGQVDQVVGEDVERATLSAYTIRRYIKGVAEGQKEMPRDDCLPMNCNVDLMGGIDFKKGCYLGQELTIRTHHTGVVRRRILPVMLYDQGGEVSEKVEYDPSAGYDNLAGADLKKHDKRKRSTGKLVGNVGNIGLGMCRLEQMTDLIISGEPSTFTREDKFVVQDANGKDLGVKAVVPDWVRGAIRGPKVQKRVA